MSLLDDRLDTLITVCETKNFTKAGEILSLTQPAVSQHIKRLEEELNTTLFLRKKGELVLSSEGEIALLYARRMKALAEKMQEKIKNAKYNINKIRIGITHTQESGFMVEALSKMALGNDNLNITLITDNIKNLYDMLGNYELDLAIVEGMPVGSGFSSLMLDTDYLVCAMSVNNPLSRRAMVTLNELKGEQMTLRLPTSATRQLFESTLESIGDSIRNFNVTIEVDNIATIKDLIRKDLGVSILPKSACMDELRKGKIAALPIENLSMARETRIVYNRDFDHPEILQEITKTYQEVARMYR